MPRKGKLSAASRSRQGAGENKLKGNAIMKETKEMMVRLPMVTAQTSQDLNKARIYPQSGRYIVKLANGDIVISDVELRPIEQGEARPYDEEVQSHCTCFVGQPEILDPDEWIPAIDLENAKNAYETKAAEQKKKCEDTCRETEENCEKLIKEKEKELSVHADKDDSALAMRRMELE
jgi:hypothetical protein